MIFVRLMGGMGNQMFQYAFARTLAHRHNCPLIIDKSLCAESEKGNSSGLTLRPYGLDVFNITGQVVDDEINGKVLRLRKENIIRRTVILTLYKIVGRFFNSWKVCIYERKDVSYDSGLLRLPDNIIVHGYFPSYKYFSGTEELIRWDFVFNTEPDQQNQEVTKLISSCNSVSVHIRRGDYVLNEKTKDKFGICSLSYYQKAVDYIIQKVKEPHFFVFTNDPDYVEQNLKIGYPLTFVTHNCGDKSFEDMRLMSLCRHNIIANSSFSWWAAWLNENSDKIVIAPSPVFDKIKIKDSNFYPDSWILLPKS